MYLGVMSSKQELLGWAAVLVVVAQVSFFFFPSSHAHENDQTCMKRLFTCEMFRSQINNLKQRHSLMVWSVIAFANGAPISEHLLSAV